LDTVVVDENRHQFEPLTVALAGDVMLGRLVNEAIAHRGFAFPWGDILPIIDSADLFLINLECAITAETTRWYDGSYKPFHFRADPDRVATLLAGGVDFAALANNHAGDFGMTGLLETIDVLDRAGIAHAGSGISLDAARAPACLHARGQRIGVLSYADYPEVWSATPAKPGINFTPVSLAQDTFDPIRSELSRLRQESDLVIFSIHWGPNMRSRPTNEFRAFAHAIVDAGADIFWGHSAHVVQGVEFHNGRIVLYDTGDFVDDYAVDPELQNDLSGLFLVRSTAPDLLTLEVVPVRIDDMKVSLAAQADRTQFLRRFTTLCAELDTVVAPIPQRFAVPVRPRSTA
jgi:poly-gamma-glutamate synthesis protein (capsule biosynthesis protein)